MAEILVSALSEALIAKLVAIASDRISLDWGVRDEIQKDKSRIINLLLDKSSSNQHIYRFVPIVAMGGIGKTTLAEIVYDDDIIKNHFEKRMWVCVSEYSNQKQVVNQLLESIHEEKKEYSSLDVMMNILQENLIKKRYLIVLDDMWNDKHNEWDDMLVRTNKCTILTCVGIMCVNYCECRLVLCGVC
ncbi:hypothetical protein MKX01_027285 [Papaver californicum]|nr:hypothetical protein MKX01_027285 [Papaver californicum]